MWEVEVLDRAAERSSLLGAVKLGKLGAVEECSFNLRLGTSALLKLSNCVEAIGWAVLRVFARWPGYSAHACP